jgi:hypothetical protein
MLSGGIGELPVSDPSRDLTLHLGIYANPLTAQDFPKARERLEDLKRGGKNAPTRQRERISRSRIEKQQDGECSVM